MRATSKGAHQSRASWLSVAAISLWTTDTPLRHGVNVMDCRCFDAGRRKRRRWGLSAWGSVKELVIRNINRFSHSKTNDEIAHDVEASFHPGDDESVLGVPVSVFTSAWDRINEFTTLKQPGALRQQCGDTHVEMSAATISRPPALFGEWMVRMELRRTCQPPTQCRPNAPAGERGRHTPTLQSIP
jgi:hypothetical protein